MNIDILLKGLRIIDGTGAEPFVGDIGVAGDRIVSIGSASGPARREIDLSGLTATPGFIDVHSHSDFTLPINLTADSKIHQGITTEIIGNCGDSAFPLIGDAREEAVEYAKTLGYEPDWVSMSEYISRVESKLTLNVVTLIGLGTLRAALAGVGKKTVSERDLTQMAASVQQNMADGACGISSGLIYPPSCWAGEDELVFLSKAMAGRGVYATHIRHEGNRLMDAIREAISVGRRAGVSVQVSHHKSAGEKNWGRTEESLSLMSEAVSQGVNVNCDVYPYTASSFSLRSMFPLWCREGPLEKFLGSLTNMQVRMKIRTSMEQGAEEDALEVAGWDRTVVSSVRSNENRGLQGKSIEEIGAEMGVSPFDAACDLLIAERGMVGVVRFSMDEKDIERVVQNSLSMIGTDAAAHSPAGILGKGKPHPRSYGTFPRILSEYVRKRELLTVEQAVHKMTGFPAAKFGFADRGLLREGWCADIIVFDEGTIADRATYEDPHQHPIGIHLIMVNGQVVLEDGGLTDARPGRVIREFRKTETFVK